MKIDLFITECKHYFGEPKINKRTLEDYEAMLGRFHEDQIKMLASDCRNACDKFPTLRMLTRVIKENDYRSEKKEEDYLSIYPMDFQKAIKESSAWHKENILEATDTLFKKYEGRNDRAHLCINAQFVFNEIIDEVKNDVRKSDVDYSKFDLRKSYVLLALGWQHKKLPGIFFERLESTCVNSNKLKEVSGFKSFNKAIKSY